MARCLFSPFVLCKATPLLNARPQARHWGHTVNKTDLLMAHSVWGRDGLSPYKLHNLI